MFNMSAPSLADIAAVTRNNDGNGGMGLQLHCGLRTSDIPDSKHRIGR